MFNTRRGWLAVTLHFSVLLSPIVLLDILWSLITLSNGVYKVPRPLELSLLLQCIHGCGNSEIPCSLFGIPLTLSRLHKCTKRSAIGHIIQEVESTKLDQPGKSNERPFLATSIVGCLFAAACRHTILKFEDA
jgi:hypothetical protein